MTDMPKKRYDVEKFFEELGTLKTQVKGLMTWQKWEMTLLTGIILLLLKVALSR